MYLKKIICQGFKSFADNTIIDLTKDITGIVGPNGSGKSNVVDAIRWVLGEQSVKSLRGEGSMTDVIFAGSKTRKAMNNATVTLIFDNSDHYLNLAFDEVSIKRRLYIDGTNEFYLNGEKCRLKDITDVISDTGFGKDAFNIISQDQVKDIISSKPEARRVMFEDAAGVSKYKKRKIEALKKLDKTHDNMDRVNDIIKELDTQIEPLREQKIKAEEYINLTDELKDLEISLTVNDITNINDKYQSNKKRIEELNNEILSISTSNTSIEAKNISYKHKINELDKEIKEAQDNLLYLTSEVEKVNSRKQLILERKKYEVDDSKLHSNLVSLKEEELKLKTEMSNLELEIKNLENKIDSLNEVNAELNKELEKNKNEKEVNEINLSNLVRRINNINIKIESLRYSIDNDSNLPNSVKKVLNNPKLNGIHNTIGNLIETEEAYSKAITTILGASSTNIVVDNEISAKEAINYLKSNDLARATFFPINIIKGKTIDDNTLKILLSFDNYINVASKLVKCESIYQKIIDNQLGNVIVVNNIDSANRLAKLINYRYRIVTLDGEVIHTGGAISGGINKARNSLTDKFDLENLIKEHDELLEQEKSYEENINEFDSKLKELDDKIYLNNKEKVENISLLDTKKNLLNEKKIYLDTVLFDINNTNNTINDTVDKEEEEILNSYYKMVEEKNTVSNKLDKLNNERVILSNELEEYEHKVRKDNVLYNEKNNELRTLEIEVNRSDVKLDNLLNILSETYSITYEKAKEDYVLNEDESKARTKVNSLRRKIKELGPVNTLAPEEYDKVSVRYEFLIHQQEDLKNAELTLLEIINDMDEVMEKEFIKTFNIINKHFSETFKELFKGGEASLILTDPNNKLESGIDIKATPPGKINKGNSLLSGGEKALTAIALLFSILKSRPVPFCILDEVEAPLDEVNVDTFGEYITKLKSKTQFVLITHKKKTMEYSDVLYGLTMQDAGVSKLVSVRLEEIK